MKEIITKWSRALMTEAQQTIPENDLDSCLTALLSCLQTMDAVMVVNSREIIDRMLSLLVFDYAEIMARVRTVSDAQKLIDLIDLLTNNECILSQCDPDAVCKAVSLASEIFARVPLLPQSLFLNNPNGYSWYTNADNDSSLFEVSLCIPRALLTMFMRKLVGLPICTH
ncbi:hypothetical protein M378DRAFT_166528 [Amanita muscaria Koide BX008]|uniref:Uncharacterized protein n=1 Tax=Amanita muscaria (strain Koide BX008) TaxID=946122 RepID=A0A0C2T5A0_AMAMK|nr:hypothetical protein M378DRAFT_166528 [Amanita muscaria Koide BX008]